ncbi:MAG TPA: leucine--tRNA ligase, partial [Chitinophagales bacterium]|nr:leucine--tRNA ligase [Chitinophagales bacterium]
MIYDFSSIEQQARKKWADMQVYKVSSVSDKPKYYVLDMFPYPSGAGLHVGHPLGYIFSDIFARYKRMKGFNVLHPMGFDAFGLPAEQYAIQTGQHPEKTTKDNIATYQKQLEKIGFSYDWSRQVSTCEPDYYKWTQWIFLQLYNSWYNLAEDKANAITALMAIFEKEGNHTVKAACDDQVRKFTAAEWATFSPKEKQDILMDYRLAFQKESFVNWCPALGTVLANDEIVNGVSERGGHPVEKKKMSQWFLRITAYADRLLSGLDTLDWSDSMKDMQRNWIGKSTGAMVSFALEQHAGKIDVFTTRVDTIYGVTFLVIAPEHELVAQITTDEYKDAVAQYVKTCAAKSDIERQAEKVVSGQFTGAYVLHPFTGVKVPVYIADYVLAGYGTGAVMAVPSGDQRDYLFAKKFDLPIIPILDAQQNLDTEADPTKEGRYINSGSINGMQYKEATAALIQQLEEKGMGYGKIQYKMRDAGYSRQRYWGEPFPVYYDQDGIIYTIPEDKLPVTLPQVDSYKPTGTGESPLANAKDWEKQLGLPEGCKMETDTMPGYAGSSWYFLRYMDPQNSSELVSKEAQEYWQNVDFYVGGSEHAVGHLLYSRFWHKFLKDIGKVSTEEPFKKMVNQGMIGGRSLLTKIDQIKGISIQLHIPVALAQNDKLYKNKFEELKQNDNRFERINTDDVSWETDKDGNVFISLDVQLEKMSKRYLNVVNPDDMVDQHGADTFRMYEMFLGPIDTAKPWDTNGISGVANFLRKFWRLYFDDMGNARPLAEQATPEELKILHKTIKRVNEDIERLAFNTCVSSFMIGVNELSKMKSLAAATLLELNKLIAPFAPHTAEALWTLQQQSGSVVDVPFPQHDEQYLVESAFNYPIQINGKHRANIELPLDMPQDEIQRIVLSDERVVKFTEGNAPKKFIVVPGRIINVVV